MFIAQEKLKNNIAEYVIYMYQVEDMVRAYQFNIEQIRANIIRPQIKSESFENEAVTWYQDIIDEMKSRGLEKKGHLHRLGEVITELIYLHNTLKDVVKDKKYLDLLSAADENIEAFQKKSDLGDLNLVEVCFQALYMKLLLKLKGQEINAESEKAFDTMRIILAYLTKAYHKMKAGDMSMFEQ
ncbi:hypothetical protein CW751_07865 [Brumimicrobium salinarum]|uniref:DUF4924 domain-containing protein n=1 Tax=Brumimicrobium salinarum TaxID=2058658 RepID=A0A2I0R277_9FLAO|nr:DUF4924 family protein [Brumimicrobium salinarum]PKR80677.1 hypothetical protein CW751_07865 [Brumimicrobium salinarum]